METGRFPRKLLEGGGVGFGAGAADDSEPQEPVPFIPQTLWICSSKLDVGPGVGFQANCF